MCFSDLKGNAEINYSESTLKSTSKLNLQFKFCFGFDLLGIQWGSYILVMSLPMKLQRSK